MVRVYVCVKQHAHTNTFRQCGKFDPTSTFDCKLLHGHVFSRLSVSPVTKSLWYMLWYHRVFRCGMLWYHRVFRCGMLWYHRVFRCTVVCCGTTECSAVVEGGSIVMVHLYMGY